MRIVFFITGDLGYHTLLSTKLQPDVIFTDKNSNKIIEYCNTYHIPRYIGNPRNEKAEIFLRRYNVDIGFSINYLFLLQSSLYNIPKKGVINLHGSLLPYYRGRTPHVWAIINGEEFTGITAHLIDENCDTGPIVTQQRVEISKYDTGQDILNKFKRIYPKIVLEIINLISENNLTYIEQTGKGSYFGKREPKDGQIDWNKTSLEIYNWIRAQSYPYPGAFTFLNSRKIIIDKSTMLQYTGNEKPGTIVSIQPVIIKTKDSALQILNFRTPVSYLKLNDILS